jgi:15-cis-phytoene desaturase
LHVPEVMVVGGGLAGLSAAALLVKEGYRVVLIEEEQDLGGKLRGLLMDGFHLDAGLHCFHYGDTGTLGNLSEKLGIELNFLHCNNASYLLKGKDRMPVPSGQNADIDDVPGFTEDEAGRVIKLFTELGKADTKEWKGKTVADFLASIDFTEDELIVGYASALCMTVLGRGINNVSAEILISHSKTVGHPGFHISVIEEGPAKLIDDLKAILDNDKVRIVLGDHVEEMEVEDKQVVKVSTPIEEFIPDAVIYTGPLQAVPDMMTGDGISAAIARLCARLEPVSGIALEMGLSTQISTIRGIMIDPKEFIIGRFPSNLDPGLAGEGAQLTSWLALVVPDDLNHVKKTRSHIKRLKRTIKKQFPDMEEAVVRERLRVIPMISGAAPLPKQALAKRPKVKNKNIKNFFLASDGVSSDGVLSGVAVSAAMQAVEGIKKLLPIKE